MRLIIAFSFILIGVLIIASQWEYAAVPVTVPTVVATYPAGREPIQLSTDYRIQLTHYATVERVDGVVRQLYISPQALEAVLNKTGLPDGTQIVIEAYRPLENTSDERRLDPEIHVAESRTTWQIADLAASSRVGTWNFGAFDANSGQPWPNAGLNDCFSCHESAATRNFLFSNPLLEAYARTNTVQYQYCARPGRAICR